MSISLKQLRYAVAVAEAEHFGRAAKACHISQPALSQQILALELLCGTVLFDRLKAGVQLTPFGAEFIRRARLVLESADALTEFAIGHVEQPDRPIRFGFIPTVAPYLLPDIFTALRRDLSALSFSIIENKTDALLDGLRDGSIDLALIATTPPAGGVRYHCEPLFEDQFLLATAPGDLPPGPVTLGSIEPERMLLLDEGHCFRDQAIAACGLNASPGGGAFAATSLSTIVEFVANGQGMTLLPAIALGKEMVNQRIAVHALGTPAPSRTLSLVWREGAPFAEWYLKIAELIRQRAGSGQNGGLPAPAETVIAEHQQ